MVNNRRWELVGPCVFPGADGIAEDIGYSASGARCPADADEQVADAVKTDAIAGAGGAQRRRAGAFGGAGAGAACKVAAVGGVTGVADGCLAVQAVEVRQEITRCHSVRATRFTFFLERIADGAYKDCWMIRECRPGDLTGMYN